MTPLLAFSVPGDPRGKGRPRATARGGFARLYTDAKTASYENLVKLAAREALAGASPIDQPVFMVVAIGLPIPASTSKKKRAAMLADAEPPVKKPDIDNVVKAVLDGCNGVAFRDDVLANRVVVERFFAPCPGVCVELHAHTPRTHLAARWTPLFAGAR